MIKKLATILLSITFALPLVACGSSGQAPTPDSVETELPQETAAEDKGEKVEGATWQPTEQGLELVYDEPYVIVDDEMLRVEVTKLGWIEGKQVWYYYQAFNKTDDTYMNIFFDQQAFGSKMVNCSIGYSTGSNGSIPPGIESGERGFGTEDVSNLTQEDLYTFSGLLRVYPSSDPSSYGGSYGESYDVPFKISVGPNS